MSVRGADYRFGDISSVKRLEGQETVASTDQRMGEEMGLRKEG